MCLLDENKTEVFLLRVLIEVGRRVKNYPPKHVRCLNVSVRSTSPVIVIGNPDYNETNVNVKRRCDFY